MFNVDYQVLHTFIRFNFFNYLSLSHFLSSFLLIHPHLSLTFFCFSRKLVPARLCPSLSPSLLVSVSVSVSPSAFPSHFDLLSPSLCFFLIVLFVFSDPGSRELVWATSWGVSTRLIGAMVMSHSDDKGTYIRILYLQMHFKYLFFLPKVSSSLFF